MCSDLSGNSFIKDFGNEWEIWNRTDVVEVGEIWQEIWFCLKAFWVGTSQVTCKRVHTVLCTHSSRGSTENTAVMNIRVWNECFSESFLLVEFLRLPRSFRKALTFCFCFYRIQHTWRRGTGVSTWKISSPTLNRRSRSTTRPLVKVPSLPCSLLRCTP